MQDTFFVSDDGLLDPYVAGANPHYGKSQAAAASDRPGAVYRHDDDATHSPMFHQVEGFMVEIHILLRSERRVDPFFAADF